MRTIGVIADDITGGMESAAILVAGGLRCDLVTAPELGPEDDDAVVIAQKTRTIDPAAAVDMVDQAATALQAGAGTRQIFLKYCATFDSTDRGNIGPCADRLMERTGAAATLFVPSFPEPARYVFQGHLFVGDRLVSESPKRFDPLTPMTDPDLVRVLSRQTDRRVGLIPLQAVRAGPDTVAATARALREAGIAYAVADACSDEDLACLAAVTHDWPLMTGGSTITAHYPAHWRRRGWLRPDAGPPSLPSVGGHGVVLAGSCAERTLDQLDAFGARWPVLFLDLAESADDAVARALDWAASRLEAGPIAIATSARPDDVSRSQAAHGAAGAAALAEEMLGRLATALRDRGVRRFLVAGGETSGAVLGHLGIVRLRIGPYEQAGVARAVAPGADPTALSLKSGKLGPLDMFEVQLERMRGT